LRRLAAIADPGDLLGTLAAIGGLSAGNPAWRVGQDAVGHQSMEAPAAPVKLNALPVTPLEQVLGSCVEALGAEHLEAEGVGEPVRRVERGADRQRVLDLLA
jgi:hypothetical protein